MDQSYYLIQGKRRLCGELMVQGSKNTVLPVLASTLLVKGKTTLFHCPRIQDVFMMTAVMEQLGCKISWNDHNLTVDTTFLKGGNLPPEYTGNLRASVLFMGALLGREGYVTMGKPGGCKIGKRPIDFHLAGFSKLGACVSEKEGIYECEAKMLSGTEILLPFPSVGATENLLLAAVSAQGDTVLSGCAREPEVCDLAKHLLSMGAQIEGIGTDRMTIRGSRKLKPADYQVPSDRIAAATYLLGAMVTKGEIRLFLRGNSNRMESILKVLEQMGALIDLTEHSVGLKMPGQILPIFLSTGPHPKPPTDIQSMVLAAALTASGPSFIEENIFESRYQVVQELKKMGGNVVISGRKASVSPVFTLYGSKVDAPDLRGGASLVVAGLGAKGNTIIGSLDDLKRGYEDIGEDFRRLGASITEIIR